MKQNKLTDGTIIIVLNNDEEVHIKRTDKQQYVIIEKSDKKPTE